MYEPIRSKSVHTTSRVEGPHRTRVEELDIRLTGHLTALLTVTDELRAFAPSAELDEAALRLAAHVAGRCDGRTPLRAAPSVRSSDPDRIVTLHHRAHTLAGHALVVATSLGNEPAATLAEERNDAHASALGLTPA